MKTREEKFSDLALKEIKFMAEAEKFSHRELADFLIQEIWGNEKIIQFGTLKCAVLDRVIDILFELDESGKYITKPNKNIKSPKFDIITEGYDLQKIKN